MKNIFVKAMAGLLTAGALAGCSSDYLDLAPTTTVSSSLVQTTEEGATQAFAGLCQTMYCPVGDFFSSYLFPNGEPYIAMLYGEVMGEDYFSYMWANRTGPNFTWVANTLPGGWIPLQGWSYCYNLINQANSILLGIDNINGDRANLDFIKAGALTIRAHAYFRLLQLYAPRWEDSSNGEKYCIVIRKVPGTDDTPLVTMNAVLKLIYDDCELAEKLFTECGVKRSFNWQPDVSVAQGVWARTAALCHDWPKAQEKAGAARKNYPVMSESDYKDGFCDQNAEWMWSAYGERDFHYYSAFGTMYACNGPYPGVWGDGAGAINYELYRKFPRDDIRKDLFFTPDKLVGTTVRAAAFWNANTIEAGSMNLNSRNELMKNQIEAYQEKHVPDNPNITWRKPYCNFQTNSSSDSKVVFGAQYKFWGKDTYGTGSFVMMRGSEMLLLEAEAACHNTQPQVAIDNLKELNAKRNPTYTCALSGDALLEEVKLQRRFELWGEGHSWFDFKRWNMPMVRNEWIERDASSNNIPLTYKIRKEPSDRGWKYAVPQDESRYNKLIDRTLVDN